MFTRKTLCLGGCLVAAIAIALPFVSKTAWTQAYPNKPVKIIVGFPAGGPNDISARLVAPLLTNRLGQQFIVENRPGAAGTVGTAAVVRSAPDGYSLLLLSIVEMITATLYDKAGFDFANDIVPVSGILSGPFIMVVNPSVAAKTVPEFIAYAKANPGKINMASAGNGTPQHVYGELFKLQTGINLVHVPYRGSAPAMTDLISGQVQVAFEPMGSALQYVRAGQLRALAISSAKQMEGLQEFPTIAEFVPGFEISGFTGIGVPRGTPRDIVERLNREINLSLDDATIKKYGADNYRVPMKGSQESFARFVKGEIEKSARAIKAANIKAE